MTPQAEAAKANLQARIEQHLYGSLRLATLPILANQTFLDWPASLGHHHAYKHGNLIHTNEVLEIALGLAGIKQDAEGWTFTLPPRHFAQGEQGINLSVLVAGAVWHDFAKIWDYDRILLDPANKPKRFLDIEDGTAWVPGSYHANIHHIQGSTAEFTYQARRHGVERSTLEKIQHAILAHHGPVKEWGSPVAPRSIEAVLLHQADYLSAHFGSTAQRAAA